MAEETLAVRPELLHRVGRSLGDTSYRLAHGMSGGRGLSAPAREWSTARALADLEAAVHTWSGRSLPGRRDRGSPSCPDERTRAGCRLRPALHVDPAAWRATGSTWASLAGVAERRAGELTDSGTALRTGWSGSAAGSAGARLTGLREELAALGSGRDRDRSGAGRVRRRGSVAARARLTAAVTLAATTGVLIDAGWRTRRSRPGAVRRHRPGGGSGGLGPAGGPRPGRRRGAALVGRAHPGRASLVGVPARRGAGRGP